MCSVPRPAPTLFWPLRINLLSKKESATAAKSLQSYPTLCDTIDGSPLGSSVPGILQARILEWVAISFSKKKSSIYKSRKIV